MNHSFGVAGNRGMPAAAVEEISFEADADCRRRTEDGKPRSSGLRRRTESRGRRLLKGPPEFDGHTLGTKRRKKEMVTAASGPPAAPSGRHTTG